MNEQQLKEMITSMLSEMVAGEKTIEQPKAPAATTNTMTTTMPVVEEGMIDDITEVDLRKQLLVKDAKDETGYLRMKAFTPARIGVGRTGTRYMTDSTLRFRADHARRQDAVF